MAAAKIVLFDIGDTLGVARPGPAPGSVAAIEIFPFVKEILVRMRSPAFGARLGIISNTPPDATNLSMSALLASAGILPLLDPALLLFSSVEGMDKTKTAFFTLAASRAGAPPGRCIFVGESEKERNRAKAAGLLPSFHPLHAFHVLGQLP